MFILRGLTIDNGGSEVRMLPEGKSLEDGMETFANDFVTIAHHNFRVKETEDKLDLCDVLSAPDRGFCGIVARGMAAKLYEGEPMMLTTQARKTDSINYYRQIIYAIARDAISNTLMEEPAMEVKKRSLSSFLRLENDADTIYEYVVTILIPVREHSGRSDGAAKLKSKIAGDYTVCFPLLGEGNTIKFRLREERIGILPEGGVAITGLRGKISPDDLTLVLDMGHVTVDGALFKGSKMYGSTVISSPFAGSTLVANVRAALTEEGIVVTEDLTQQAIATGTVRKGKKTENVASLVKEMKESYVHNYLLQEVLQLLNMNGINASQIQNFVPIGAGMNDGGSAGSIIDSLVKAVGLQSADVYQLSDDLRYVNIQQASKFTSALCKKFFC